MALGVPVLAYGRGGATETVTEGKSGYFFTELTARSVSEALQKLTTEGVSWSPEKIRTSAERFNTDTFLKAIDEVVAAARPS
jgi:glycosyltransferase involved in cell wall biosynthesis